MVIVGARPQFVKSSILISMLKKDRETELQLIHTGQHYQFEMSQIFFHALNLPEPDINLNVRSASHACQTASMMTKLEEPMIKLKPDIVLVPGDTNSTLAGALTAIKLHIPVGHIEAGLRSYDLNMPEEVNRRLTDGCSLLLFAPTKNAVENLLKEGKNKDKIFQVGDTMVDVLYHYMPLAKKHSNILNELKLTNDSYALLTLHRPENVDNKERFVTILEALETLKELPIIFPIHPRAQKMAMSFGLYKKMRRASNIHLINPVSYLDFILLMESSKLVLTDSGGIQKEAFLLGVPCVTFRYNTEWPETLELGANFLVGANKKLITETVKKLFENKKLKNKIKSSPNPYGDGTASKKIINIIKMQYAEGKLKILSPTK
jgi:UDP-N-acetylglucosamine 2-epimerase (non-hydrolysing)